MKKFLLMLLLLVVPFMLVGCGDKDEDDDDAPKKTKGVEVIECTSEQTSSGFTVGIYANVEFNEKKQEVGKAYAEYTLDYSSFNDAQKEAYEKSDVCQPYNSSSTFTSCKAKFENNKAIIHVGLNTEEMKAGKDDKKVTAKEFAEQLEKSLGGKCTVK